MINRNKKRRIIINRNKKGRNGWLERRKERFVFKKFKPHSTNAPLEFTPGEIEIEIERQRKRNNKERE